MIRHSSGYELSIDHRDTQYNGDECRQQQKPGYPHYPRLIITPRKLPSSFMRHKFGTALLSIKLEENSANAALFREEIQKCAHA